MPTCFVVLVAIWYIQLPLIKSLKTDYCKIVPSKHFLCEGEILDERELCFAKPILLSSQDKRDAINTLNNIRADVANGRLPIGHRKFMPPRAANMFLLKWDNECEKAATNILRYCANRRFFSKISNIFARFETGLYLDLELPYSTNTSISIADLIWSRIINNDNRFHDYEYNVTSRNIIGPTSSQPFKLSILLKAEISAVGCALTIRFVGTTLSGNLACVFGGITTWDTPAILYENGPKCSNCPAGSQCSIRHDGLCDCRIHCYSYSRDVRKSGFYDSYAIVVDKETGEDVIIPLKDLAQGSYDSTFRYLHSTETMTKLTATATDNTTLTMTTKTPITNLTITENTTNLQTTFSAKTQLTTTEALTINQTDEQEYSSTLSTITTYATTLKMTAEMPITNLLITEISNLPTIFATTTETLTSKQTDVRVDGHEHNLESISSEPSPFCIAMTLFATEIVTHFVISVIQINLGILT